MHVISVYGFIIHLSFGIGGSHFIQRYLISCETETGKGCFPKLRIYLDQGHVPKSFHIKRDRYLHDLEVVSVEDTK